MLNAGQLPQHVVAYWPEAFEGVIVKQLPLQYIECIMVQFIDGTTMQMDPGDPETVTWEMLDIALSKVVAKYDDIIVDVQFKLQIEIIKHDVLLATAHFFKGLHL